MSSLTTRAEVEFKRKAYVESREELFNMSIPSFIDFEDFNSKCIQIVKEYGNTDTGSKVINQMVSKGNEICEKFECLEKYREPVG